MRGNVNRYPGSANPHYLHGKSHGPEYRVWKGIKQRCLNAVCPSWPNYGGRGIAVCDRWLSFANFYADMGDKPSGWTLERLDNNGPYSPKNCVWATRSVQARNKRNNRWVTFRGRTQLATEWAKELGIPNLWSRLALGWSMERALTDPIKGTSHRLTPELRAQIGASTEARRTLAERHGIHIGTVDVCRAQYRRRVSIAPAD